MNDGSALAALRSANSDVGAGCASLAELAFHRGLGPPHVVATSRWKTSQVVVALFGITAKWELLDLAAAHSALEADPLAGVRVGPFLGQPLKKPLSVFHSAYAVGESLPEFEVCSCCHIGRLDRAYDSIREPRLGRREDWRTAGSSGVTGRKVRSARR